jgi:muramoyltetrapeptide carboxypeptidase
MKRSDFIKKIGLGAASVPFLNTAGSKTNRYENLVKPKRLKKGDTVAFTAPAGIVFDKNDFERMEAELTDMGLNVVFGEYVRHRHGYFSGTDRQRARDLNRFFADPDIDGIVAVRGGWGCARILPYLDFDMIRENPKVYCGFSDNTTLHLAFLEYCNMVSYHGPNGASEWTNLTRSNFEEVLMEGKQAIFESNSEVDVLYPGLSEGRLIGGNLTILTTSLGTPYQPDTDGAILYVEDIAEPPYKIDRMLTHLREAGMMDNLKGFMFGGCTNCPESSGANFTLREVLKQHIRPLTVPSVLGVDISHDPDNFTVPVGLRARLDADKGTFRLLEDPVSYETTGA